jgi:hypothetical protein
MVPLSAVSKGLCTKELTLKPSRRQLRTNRRVLPGNCGTSRQFGVGDFLARSLAGNELRSGLHRLSRGRRL